MYKPNQPQCAGSPKILIASWSIVVSLLAAFAAQPVMAADPDLEKKLESLQREIEALKAQMRTSGGAPQQATGGPQVTFGGQYRINAYSVDNDVPGQDDQRAARAHSSECGYQI